MIPVEAVEAAAKAMEDAALRLIGSDLGTVYRNDIARIALEAAAPYMQRGDGDYRPGWDDRKALAGIWQEHAMLPVEGLSEGVYEALIEVAAWGYQRRMDEEL